MNRSLSVVVCLFVALAFVLAGAVLGQNLPHISPLEGTQVPISGWPFYVENLTKGSPLSDYGSHYGIKAAVNDDGDAGSESFVPANAFLNIAHYSATTDLAGQLGQSHILFRNVANGREFLEEPKTRTIEFAPYGWTEQAEDGSFHTEGRVLTAGEDVFLIHITITNTTDDAVSVRPVLRFQPDGDPMDESLLVSRFQAPYLVHLDQATGMAVITYDGGEGPVRAISIDGPVHDAITPTDSDRLEVSGQTITLQPEATDGKNEITILMGIGDNAAQAVNHVQKAQYAIGDSVDAFISDVQKEWSSFLESLPHPHAETEEMERLYQMAATGLRMNVYAPRGNMTLPCSVPSKAHFNRFWGWDTAFQALAHSEYDTELAKQEMTTLFSGPLPHAFLEMKDDLVPTWGLDLTQPPVQGWVIRKIYHRDRMMDVDWLLSMYEASSDYLIWWMTTRDPDSNGLYQYQSSMETGWDDNPRYHCEGLSSICIQPVDNIDALDLNVWLYTYMSAMRRIAMELELEDESLLWESYRDNLGTAIDTLLFDEELGTYFDLERNESGRESLNRILTPAMFFPFFAGIPTNTMRITSVLEGYLLAPEHFWGNEDEGNFPIPTVAYSDAAYDWEGDGFYWQGQSWLVTGFVAAKALYRYGYEEESRQLVRRILERILAADPGGIYEAYDAFSGKIGFGTSGRILSLPGDPSAFQFGWSCGFIMEMLLGRHESARYIMPGESGFTGYVREVRELLSGRQYFTLFDVIDFPPFTEVWTLEDKALDSQPDEIYIRFTDPYENMVEEIFVVNFPRIDSGIVFAEDENGVRTKLETIDVGGGVAFEAALAVEGIDHYVVIAQEQQEESDDSEGFACGCDTAGSGSSDWILILASALLFFFLVSRSSKRNDR